MSYMIQNGADGAGYKAKVDERSRLYVDAITNSDLQDSSIREGRAFSFSEMGYTSITTTGTESAILYIKNTDESRILEIHDIRTCGTVIQKWKMYKDDDAGDIVTDASAGVITNMNFGSSNTATALCYVGADSKTRSGGSMISHHINDVGHSTDILEGALILDTGNSITLTCEVDSAGDVCTRVLAHFHDK